MHVAPPKDRLDPPAQSHAPVIAQHLTQRRVRGPLDPVVHRWHHPPPGWVHESEEHTPTSKPVQAVTGLDEAGVRVLPPTARRGSFLGEERLPAHAPRLILAHPCLSLRQIADTNEPLAQGVQLLGRGKLRAGRRRPRDLPEHMEGAPLYPRLRPDVLAGLLEPTAPISDHQLRGRDPLHESRPRPRVLTARHVPAQHVLLTAGDQHDRFTAQVNPVDEHDLMNLIDERRQGATLPTTVDTCAERTSHHQACPPDADH